MEQRGLDQGHGGVKHPGPPRPASLPPALLLDADKLVLAGFRHVRHSGRHWNILDPSPLLIVVFLPKALVCHQSCVQTQVL